MSEDGQPREPRAATTLESLRSQIYQRAMVRLDSGAVIAVKAVAKERAMDFASRLERLEGSGDVFAIATDMIQTAVDLPGLNEEDAFALFTSSGGFTGELFRTVGKRCGVGELVELLAAEFDSRGNREAPASD